jgi:hypothetical protein
VSISQVFLLFFPISKAAAAAPGGFPTHPILSQRAIGKEYKKGSSQ